jgi:hypothetical protein
MKKQTVMALVLLLLIPVVLVLGGVLFSLIHPEIAAGHANYERNFHLLTLLKVAIAWATAAAVAVLWLLVCLEVIRSKGRSSFWLFLAALGPFGLAVLAMLGDRAPVETDPYTRFMRSLNGLVRVGYEFCTFLIAWVFAYEAMVLKRTWMMRYEAVTTGDSIAQVVDRHNASGGMWAFSEGLEVMFLVVLLYVLRPVVFNVASRITAIALSSKPR